jgi:hypothetical protein
LTGPEIVRKREDTGKREGVMFHAIVNQHARSMVMMGGKKGKAILAGRSTHDI